MLEVLRDVAAWHARGCRVAIARVVDTVGSAPREPGATMAINDRGEVSGSVSGGCVEGAVASEALACLGVSEVTTRSGSVLEIDTQGVVTESIVHTFGYSDDEAFSVGLTCGGTLRILIETQDLERYSLVCRLLESKTAFVRVTVIAAQSAAGVLEQTPDQSAWLSQEGISAYEVHGGLAKIGATLIVVDGQAVLTQIEASELEVVLLRDAIAALESGLTTVRHYGRNGQAKLDELEVLFEVFAPPPQMLIFGAVDFTLSLARLAKMLGYRVTVCDARPLFATKKRFPMVDDVTVGWPNAVFETLATPLGSRDAVCVLTHDPKFDIPAITESLKTKVGYLGAMGSRRTCDERLKRLIDLGYGEDALDRIMAPIGLGIGARTPEETAVAIMAEIISKRYQKVPTSLRNSSGPIHSLHAEITKA